MIYHFYARLIIKIHIELIDGSVVTMTSLSQWNLFDVRYISGGNVEQMMIVNALSILQFLIGWKVSAKKLNLKILDKKSIQKL